jgi:hypothetical protein
MGSFDMRCSLSGLAITCGTPIKYLLLAEGPYKGRGDSPTYAHDLWFPRTPPANAVYSDYGNATIKGPKGIRAVWKQMFLRDMIDLPTGDNPYHEVGGRRSFPLDYVLHNLRCELTLVSDVRPKYRNLERAKETLKRTGRPITEESLKEELQWYTDHGLDKKSSSEIPAHIPTWKRVEKLIRAHKLPMRAYGAGYAQVIAERSGYEASQELNKQLIKILTDAGFEAFPIRGTSSHPDTLLENDSAQRVCVRAKNFLNVLADHNLAKADKKLGYSEIKPKRCLVQSCFIRQDIWDVAVAIAKRERANWLFEPKQNWENLKEWRTREPGLDLGAPGYLQGPYDGYKIGLELKERGKFSEKSWESFRKNCDELSHVSLFRGAINNPWMPSAYAGQTHYWGAHKEFHEACEKIASSVLEKERRDNEEGV